MDECVGPGVVSWLAGLQHDVGSVQLDNPGLADPNVLQQSVNQNRILITCDKDYGSLVFEHGLLHVGIILLRITDDKLGDKIAALIELLEQYPDRLAGNFVVTNGRRVRIIEPESPQAGVG